MAMFPRGSACVYIVHMVKTNSPNYSAKTRRSCPVPADRSTNTVMYMVPGRVGSVTNSASRGVQNEIVASAGNIGRVVEKFWTRRRKVWTRRR